MAILLAPIAINLDASAYLAALEDLRLLSPSLPKDVGEFLVGVFDTPDLSAHLGSVEQDDLPAFGASELRVHLKPSDRFLMLLSAVRAGDCDLGDIENILGHDPGSNNITFPSPSIKRPI